MYWLAPLLLAITTTGLLLGQSARAEDGGKPEPATQPAKSSPATTQSVDPTAQGWQLVWADDFEKDGLPDPAKWDYEQGFVRNNEAQFYTKARLENARVENHTLIIECRKENYKIPEGSPKTQDRAFADYTSASLITYPKFAWQYGRIEVKAKIPHGLGVWPAIWMLGENFPKGGWPQCGEIDIMEFVGHTPDLVHGTLHFFKDGKLREHGGNLKVDKPWEDFHIYAIEWTPERMDFYYDQTRYFSYDLRKAEDRNENAYHKPFYLILNFALGGSWGRKIDDAILPQQFLIKYVHVYQKPAQGQK